MKKQLARGLAALPLACVCACGGDETPPAAQQRAMVQTRRAAPDPGDNRAPLLARVELEPRQPQVGQPIEARVDASDPDNDRLQLSYRWTVNGTPVPDAGATLPAPRVAAGDRVELEVVASDGLADSQPVRARVSVEAKAPIVGDVSFDPPEGVKPGDAVTALVDVANEDDSRLRLSYRWLVNGEDSGERDRTFSTAGLRRGDRVQVEVNAFDGDVASPPFVSAELVLGNSPPVLAGIPKPERDGDAFRYQFEAKDPDGDRSLRFSLVEAPQGMTIDPIYGVATWRPSKEQAGVHVIEVAVRDSQGEATALRFQVTVTASETPAGAAGGEAAPPAAAANAGGRVY
jgi:hypothetical protein